MGRISVRSTFDIYIGLTPSLYHSTSRDDKRFIALKLWRQELQGRTIVIHCDNMAVVSSISSGRSWHSFMGSVARNIWLLTVTHDIELTVVHIPGKKNTFMQTRCRGGMGAGFQKKWPAKCFTYHGIKYIKKHVF